MSIEVHDPGNRLPRNIDFSWPTRMKGVLWVPDRGVSIHPESLRRFLTTAILPGRKTCYIPEIPVSTELGLPSYEPLLYWLPSGEGRMRLSWQLLVGYLKRKKPDEIWEGLYVSATRVTQTGEEEQIHYFVDNLKAICPKPLQVSVVVSNVCNLKCIMCPYHSPQIRQTHQTDFFSSDNWISWELLDRLASECGELKIPVKMGNIEEPLLHPKIIDFVRECRIRGVPSVHITTNGKALTTKMSRNLLEAGLTSLYVSIDAARPETYQKIRGGSLERIESNVRTFLRLRQEMGVSCRVMPSYVRNKEAANDEDVEFRERWVDEGEGVIIYNLAEYNEGNSVFTEVNPIVREKIRRSGRWPCLNPWQEIYILPDGKVYYCCETISKLAFEKIESMGNYPSQGLEEIWLGGLFTALRRDLILNELSGWPACRDCGIWMAHVMEFTEENGCKVTRNMITEIVECMKK